MTTSTMYRTVPPEGPKDAKIVIVGESPGMQEVRYGRPFIGPSGRILERALREAGLSRSSVYITNVMKEMPARSGDFFNRTGEPKKETFDWILSFLAETKELNPNVYVAVGNLAMFALLGFTGITKWRGSILFSKVVGKKVIPVIHPAWYLRGNMGKLQMFFWDFQRIAKESETPDYKEPEARFYIYPSAGELEEVFQEMMSAPYLVVDTEWSNPSNLVYVGFSDSKDRALVLDMRSHMHLHYATRLLESDVPKIMHNAMFDVVALRMNGYRVENVIHDTMVAWHCCWGDLGDKKLETLASILTRWPYYKDEGQFITGDAIRGQKYCGTDCIVTFESFEKIESEEFQISGGRRGYEISMGLMKPLLESSVRGIRIDLDRLNELREWHIGEANRLEKEIQEEIGVRINCRSPQQVAAIVYDVMKVKRAKRSTSQDELMDIAASLPQGKPKELLTKIIKIRRHLNTVSRYLSEECICEDGRVRTNWNLAGTKNGRLSSTKPWWNGMPLQTVPEEIRSIFVPDEGHVFIGWDLEQAEARVVAALIGDTEQLRDMDSGVDIHLKLASKLPFGLTYEQLLEKKEKEGKNFPERFLAKTCKHSLNYFQTWVGLKSTINKDYIDTGIGVDAATAKMLVNSYYSLHPALEWWWKEVLRAVQTSGYLVNPWGRRRNFLTQVTWGSHEHRDAIAFFPQSTVADLTTITITNIYRLFPQIQVLAHMHDGGLVQVPEDMADKVADALREEGLVEIKIGTMYIKIPIEVKMGRNWREV